MSGGNGALIHDANLILLLSFNKKYRNSFIIAVIGSQERSLLLEFHFLIDNGENSSCKPRQRSPARSDMRDVKINTAQRKLCVSCLQLNNIISVL